MAANDDALSTANTTKGDTETSLDGDEDFLASLLPSAQRSPKSTTTAK